MEPIPNCLLIVTVEVDPGIEAEWNRWYDEVHLPAALACPGVLHGRRYRSAGAASESDRGLAMRHERRIYTTVYALDSPEAVATPEFQAMRGWYQFAARVRSRTLVIEALPPPA